MFRNIDSNQKQLKNSVIETDVVSIAARTGSVDNYAGNGFTIESRTIQTEGEGARAYDAVKDRRYVHRWCYNRSLCRNEPDFPFYLSDGQSSTNRNAITRVVNLLDTLLQYVVLALSCWLSQIRGLRNGLHLPRRRSGLHVMRTMISAYGQQGDTFPKLKRTPKTRF